MSHATRRRTANVPVAAPVAAPVTAAALVRPSGRFDALVDMGNPMKGINLFPYLRRRVEGPTTAATARGKTHRCRGAPWPPRPQRSRLRRRPSPRCGGGGCGGVSHLVEQEGINNQSSAHGRGGSGKNRVGRAVPNPPRVPAMRSPIATYSSWGVH